MKTISEKLRQLAEKPSIVNWSKSDWDAMDEISVKWRGHWEEDFDDMTRGEWFLFCNFVAEALETQ